MHIDARELPKDHVVDTEVCIIGAGPAGISIAKELNGQPFRVCLLETGGYGAEPDIQALASDAGSVIGDSYPRAMSTRFRQWGGTSNTWEIDLDEEDGIYRGVRHVPLDPIDFEKREGIPYSGWPITRTDLDPYYERAQAMCKAGPYRYDTAAWADKEAQPLPFSDRVETRMFQFTSRDVFIYDYRRELQASSNVTIYTHATVLELETNDDGTTVTRVYAGDLGGQRFWIAPKIVVLAMGGFDSARLLLLSNRVNPSGLGNEHDVVGRFLMDHPVIRAGMFFPSDRHVISRLSMYDTYWKNNTMVIGKPVLSDKVMREEQLLNINLAMFPRTHIFKYNLLRTLFPKGKKYRSPAIAAARSVYRSLKRKQMPKDLIKNGLTALGGLDDFIFDKWRSRPWIHYAYGLNVGGWSRIPDKEDRYGCFEVFHITEQAPDPSNRITLSDVRDGFGQPKLQIHWQWHDINVRSVRRAIDIFAQEFETLGLGHLKIELDHGMPQVFLPSAHHHMGLTRMHVDPKQGVVDANCKVHGVSNAFIASSSVFPTGGYANPTLTIIALAIRVADQIKAEL